MATKKSIETPVVETEVNPDELDMDMGSATYQNEEIMVSSKEFLVRPPKTIYKEDFGALTELINSANIPGELSDYIDGKEDELLVKGFEFHWKKFVHKATELTIQNYDMHIFQAKLEKQRAMHGKQGMDERLAILSEARDEARTLVETTEIPLDLYPEGIDVVEDIAGRDEPEKRRKEHEAMVYYAGASPDDAALFPGISNRSEEILSNIKPEDSDLLRAKLLDSARADIAAHWKIALANSTGERDDDSPADPKVGSRPPISERMPGLRETDSDGRLKGSGEGYGDKTDDEIEKDGRLDNEQTEKSENLIKPDLPDTFEASENKTADPHVVGEDAYGEGNGKDDQVINLSAQFSAEFKETATDGELQDDLEEKAFSQLNLTQRLENQDEIGDEIDIADDGDLDFVKEGFEDHNSEISNMDIADEKIGLSASVDFSGVSIFGSSDFDFNTTLSGLTYKNKATVTKSATHKADGNFYEMHARDYISDETKEECEEKNKSAFNCSTKTQVDIFNCHCDNISGEKTYEKNEELEFRVTQVGLSSQSATFDAPILDTVINTLAGPFTEAENIVDASAVGMDFSVPIVSGDISYVGDLRASYQETSAFNLFGNLNAVVGAKQTITGGDGSNNFSWNTELVYGINNKFGMPFQIKAGFKNSSSSIMSAAEDVSATASAQFRFGTGSEVSSGKFDAEQAMKANNLTSEKAGVHVNEESP